jgi:hypothetical protein
MTKSLTILAMLSFCSVGYAGLLTNFAGSYAQYQECTMQATDFNVDGDVDGGDFLTWQKNLGMLSGASHALGDADKDGNIDSDDLNHWLPKFGTTGGLPDSVCFKLYLDPEGISDGQATVVVVVPDLGPGLSRFAMGNANGIIDTHPGYTARVVQTSITKPAGLERFEATVRFTAINQMDPPAGPITLFGYQVQDAVPDAGLAGVQLGFTFKPGDFITTFDPDPPPGVSATFDHTQLTAPFPLPLPDLLMLDVNLATGGMRIRNPSTQTLAITYYEILSAAGSLNVAGWNSLDDAEMDPPGIGWEEAGGAGPGGIAETNLMGALPLFPGESVGLGNVFNLLGAHDLVFSAGTNEGALITGVVNYMFFTAVAVPEPGGAALALLSLAALAHRQRRAGNFAL